MVVIDVLKTKICPHCSKATELAKRVARRFGNGVFVKETFLDTPEGNKIAMRYHVMSVPAFLISGKLAFVGMPSEEALRRAVEREMK